MIGLGFPPLGGLKIVETLEMSDPVEDWSGVRSPARAARRRCRGFPQRIVIRKVPKPEIIAIGDKLFMHPETAAKLYAEMDRRKAAIVERRDSEMAALFGGSLR